MTLTTSSVIIDGVEGDKVSPQQSIQSFITMIASAPASALIAICKAFDLSDKAIACNFLTLSGEAMVNIISLLIKRIYPVSALGIKFEVSAIALDKVDVTVHFSDIATGLRKSSLRFKMTKFGAGLKTPASTAQNERFRTFYNELKAELTTQVQFLDELGLLDRTK